MRGEKNDKEKALSEQRASLCTINQQLTDGVKLPQLPRGGSPPHAVLLYAQDNQQQTFRDPASGCPSFHRVGARPGI